MRRCYRVYGLQLESSIDIAGLTAVEPSNHPHADCVLDVGPVVSLPDAIPLDTTPIADEEPGIRIERSGGTYLFIYRDNTRFRVEERGRRIATSWDSTPEDMATYLLGPVLAFVLRLRGTLALHASALVLNDTGALLFAGHAGAGKSTTATAFLAHGATMLTDDVAAIEWRDERPHVLPGYPRLRLWDDSAAALYGAADALPLLTPTWEKRFVDASASFAAEPAPIRAIIALAGRGAETRIRPLHGHEAVMAVLVRTSMSHLLDDASRASELAQIAALVQSAPVLEVIARDDLHDTATLVHAITAAIG